ncbi:MAG: GIY-YIG nuclease family protein [Saprospiraceae bacterium]|nr:GIY-YIG nuclease family protein [Saprospiraceae bacterium]
MIESLTDGTLYKGYTTDFIKRVEQHNNGESAFTSTKMPWKLVFLQKFDHKKSALIAEKKLKRANQKYLRWLIDQPINLINTHKI